MKRLLLCILSTISFIIINAQNTSPFWSLAGNSNVSATNSKLGTTNWNPLRFFTNNLERMRVNNNGNVGIGTKAPLQKLDVLGNINIGPNFGLYMGNQKLLSTPVTDNLYLGYRAGESSFGTENVFIGKSAGQNGGGFRNTIIGNLAGMNNSGAGNTFCGYRSGVSNTSGDFNTFYGNATGELNTGGSSNCFFGTADLQFNTMGSNNCAFGNSAGGNTTTSDNCFYGHIAGRNNATGAQNTYIGASSDANATNYSNSTSLGYASMITASNQVRIGNSAVTSIGGFQPWSNLSDGRFKKNIKENVPGLEFISKLRPVTYTLDMDALDRSMNPRNRSVKNTGGNLSLKNISGPASQKDAAANATLSKIIHTGFVAQEVEETAKKLDFEFSGVDAPKNDQDYYGLRYSEFVVPLVKAVQELDIANRKLDSANKAKEERITRLEEEMIELKEFVRGLDGGRLSPGRSWMKQNTPNPVSVSTTIQFSVPEDVQSARILITNVNGQQLKVYNVSGTGSINFNTGTLPSGTYNYSLVSNGQTIVTKKLVIAKGR